MRLSCPNCGAQYEVPAEAVPPTGREVQCSACGHNWFEQPPGERPKLVGPDPLDLVRRVEGDAEEDDDIAEIGAAPRSQVPHEVAVILREEAALEAEARAREAEARAREAEARAREAAAPPPPVRRVRVEAPPEAEPSPPPAIARPERARPGGRRGRAEAETGKPIDLNQINSTLRSQADRLGVAPPHIEPPRRRRRAATGFGGGFWGAILVLALLAGLYAFRPQIVAALPAVAPILDPYARAVERGRSWLDAEVGRLMGAR